ncbi:MAG: hypothetical protein WAX69_26105, partial [Victivallales bacterium]
MEAIIKPFFSPLLPLALAVALNMTAEKYTPLKKRLLALIISAAAFFILYGICAMHAPAAKLLAGMNSPFVPVITFLVFPALFMSRNRYYNFFLAFPALVLVSAAVSVFLQYKAIPSGEKNYYWFLVPSEMLLAGVASFLILMEPLMSLGRYRALVRFTAFLVLMYGGFAFRQNYIDYKEMLSRRKNYTSGILNLSETSPVMSAKGDGNYAYIPSAPCRFSADGGYIQGCNMEMTQRFLQLNFLKVSRGEVAEMQFMSKILAASTLFMIFTFVFARWFCGWICP